jgi:hypothetical protein
MNDFSKLNIESISFPEAINLTQTLMTRIMENQLSESDLEKIVTSLVATKNGARGFFVAYLTGDFAIADSPSQEIVTALQKSPEIVTELLVKNLAMSSAMTVTHLRNNDRDNAASSQTVCRRTANLIELVELDSITAELKKLRSTIDSGKGDYQDFLTRWQYDTQQQAEISKAIDPLIAN